MKRSERMLSMAKAKSKVDEEIGRMLDIPKYETTKGLEATEIDLLLQDTVTSSVVESDSEPYVDSGDEYKPEEISESDSDNSEISESPFSLKDADTHKKNKKNIGSKRKLNKIDISESPFSLKDADTHEKNKKNIGSKGELNKQMQSNDPTEASEILNVDNKVVNKSTKKIARFNPETESYGAPSLALHMGTELKDCIDVAHNMTLKKGTLGSEINNRLREASKYKGKTLDEININLDASENEDSDDGDFDDDNISRIVNEHDDTGGSKEGNSDMLGPKLDKNKNSSDEVTISNNLLGGAKRQETIGLIAGQGLAVIRPTLKKRELARKVICENCPSGGGGNGRIGFRSVGSAGLGPAGEPGARWLGDLGEVEVICRGIALPLIAFRSPVRVHVCFNLGYCLHPKGERSVELNLLPGRMVRMKLIRTRRYVPQGNLLVVQPLSPYYTSGVVPM
ncbi:hypothetical protein GEV33_000062 [Tenebrio molitor]|uniref:Uncharacterized protein n=1 Tax=Tenebrio molitor TaxID=7067 RepID=A0A8J6LKW8_TENMO|nr:hypothetical protein GEV33_000062 [Tenebrio molitor]